LALAVEANAKINVVRCVAPMPVRGARLKNAIRICRTCNQATDRDHETWYAHLPPDALVVSTVDPLPTYVDRVLAFVRAS
jgi:hypothetical protein